MPCILLLKKVPFVRHASPRLNNGCACFLLIKDACQEGAFLKFQNLKLSDLCDIAVKAGSIAEDLVEQILGLYTPEAIGGKADSLLAAEVLMMIFETPKTSTVLPTKLRNAALAVITPEILAAFPPEAQTVLTIVSTLPFSSFLPYLTF